MAFTKKNYIDLAGLTTFRDSLKTKFSNNSTTMWSVNHTNNTTKAIQDGNGRVITDTYLTINEAKTKYVPLTRKIADMAFNRDITAEELKSSIGIETNYIS